MTSLAELFDYGRDTNLIVQTYSEREGGYAYPYQVRITVSVNLNDSRQRRLESHFSTRKGYNSCVCNRSTNVVTICHEGGLSQSNVMSYIRRLDPNAREVA